MNYRKKFLFLGVLFAISVSAMAQNIALRLKNVTVKKAMTELKQKSGYSFVYEGSDINVGKKVNVNANTVSQAVEQILAGQHVSYRINGKSIIVSKKVIGAIDDVLAAGCDTLVTADLKYNHFEEAKYRGLNLIDAGHFETENPVCAVLERVVREALPELTVLRAKAHKDETQFL